MQKKISNEAEAEQMLAQLEAFYRTRVLPLNKFCQVIQLWMDCIVKRNTEAEELKVDEALRPHPYFKYLEQMSIDIQKSNLLGRLLIAKQKFRTRPCPLHKGHWNGDVMFFERCPHGCDGTGWLPERKEDGRYTGGNEIYLDVASRT